MKDSVGSPREVLVAADKGVRGMPLLLLAHGEKSDAVGGVWKTSSEETVLAR